ncbi:hypothetical protein JXB31_03330 [Candidatus Woesearchaeota archaeon]|nr:hypothetical protein [Candidatus Woesearchaeota archaeon]
MRGFEKVVADLKSLKIQGAQAVAKEAVKSLYHVVTASKAIYPRELLRELHAAMNTLVKTRPTEPCMRNALQYILSGLSPHDDIVLLTKSLDEHIRSVLEHFSSAEQNIKTYGARKVRESYTVFTHCHSSSVIGILLEAKKQGKSFEVHNTETRPLFQGRITAKELSGSGIKVSHYIDSAARLALKKADICLFGADAVQSDGSVINKIGTELFVDIANTYEVPVYFCTDSWKFDPKSIYGIDEPIENRNRDEVWKSAPKRITIHNPAFELVEPTKISGIISEHGIYRPGVFVEEVKRKYPWLF